MDAATPDPTVVGKYADDGFVVRTTDNVAQYCSNRFGDMLRNAGARLTEADWRLFTTLVRFDAVYNSHFKCNLRRIVDYPNLSNYVRELYQMPGIAETVNMDHIKRHYFMSMTAINPTRIVPLGPEQDFSAPHDRRRFER